MLSANTPCNSEYLLNSTTEKKHSEKKFNLLQLILKLYRGKKKINFTEMRYLSKHIQKDIGFWDVQPEDRTRKLPY